MKVRNMESSRGDKVPNQFIVSDVMQVIITKNGKSPIQGDMFQSYDSNIAFKTVAGVFLDEKYWDYSVTTGKYRNQFLGETKKETQAKIDSGEYKLVNLN